LIDCAGRTLERKRLIEYVWHQEEENASRSLDTHIKRLRSKLGKQSAAIRTLRNKGYQFTPVED
jgi:two-component system phosphate regulon response regulator PhoB